MTAADVVKAYVDTRTDAGMFTAKIHRAIMGKYAKELLAGGRWDEDTILMAVKAFAHTRRHPRFLEEWLREVWTRQEIQAHMARKESERPAQRVDRPLGRPDFSWKP